ncbi:MAG: VWA domain-containing protein [bacterium]|nr:VWA domain-containing protein [bacterium]
MGFERITFHEHTWWLLFLLPVVIPLIWWRWARQGRHASVRFSSVGWLASRGATLRSRARIIVPLLRTLAVAVLIICLARPRRGNEETRILAEGVAIQALVDVSGSMEALDFNLDGEQVNRLAAIKAVFRKFVLGDGDELAGRPDDLIGLITFAGYADTKSPLTLDHATVLDILTNTDTVGSVEVQRRAQKLQRMLRRAQRARGERARARELQADLELLSGEDGTAIGDAIGLAVKNLTELERRRGVSDERRIKSKIIVLMTDGANNAGDLAPAQAAQMAAAFGFKIHTIGVGTGRQVLVPQVYPDGSVRLGRQNFPIDEATLQSVAELTGGKYFRARDADALHDIYAEIDELEKTETEEKRFMQFRELATESAKLGAITLPPLLMIVLGLLVLEIGLANTVFRKIP